MLEAAVAAIDPIPLVSRALEAHPLLSSSASIDIVAAGKAAEPMLRAALDTLADRVASAVGAGPPSRDRWPSVVQWFTAGHPLPTVPSVDAGEAALALGALSATRGHPLLVLLSGGASAMLAAPASGVSLDDKRTLTGQLLKSGQPIAAVNCVRRHLSRIKGGRLALAAQRSVTFALSDVHQPEDSPCDIGSGPTVADPTTFADALTIVRGCGREVPPAIIAHLERGAAGALEETAKPDDPRLASSSFTILANRHTAMQGAEREARRLGYDVHVLQPATHGEASVAGRRFAHVALETAPLAGPLCVIGSGETIVRVTGAGRGGRNQEFVLGAAEVLAGQPGVLLASMGTDGVDGPTDAAGGVVSGSTISEALEVGLPVATALARNDAYSLLHLLDDLIEWGPTGTNVGDIHVLLTMGR